MDSLIAMRATGPPDEFALKLNLSRSTLFEMLQEMKGLGVDIRYSQLRGSYYYADERRIIVKVERIGGEQIILSGRVQSGED
jgi:biotin operon repressor